MQCRGQAEKFNHPWLICIGTVHLLYYQTNKVVAINRCREVKSKGLSYLGTAPVF